MRKKYFIFAVATCFALAIVCSCGNKSDKEQASVDEEEVDEMDDESEAGDESDTKALDEADDDATVADKDVKAFIEDMYNNDLYIEYEFLEEHCTKRMLRFLADQYDYDGEGYAVWLFRTSCQDNASENPEDNIVKKITKRPGGWWRYEFTDGGWRGINEVKVVEEDGILKFDELRTVYDECLESLNADSAE